MDAFSIWHWLVVLLVVLLLFGGGKVSGLMGDLAKGIKAFKKNMAGDDDASIAASAPAPGGSGGSNAGGQPGAPAAGTQAAGTQAAETQAAGTETVTSVRHG